MEFRDEAGELKVGDTVTVEAFEAGQTVKVAGTLEGQGLPGHDQAPQLRRRPEVATARTTCAPRARSAPRPTPSRVFKGIRGPGQMGNKRVTQRGLTIVEVIADAEPAARPRRRARARKGGTVEVRTDG